MMATKKANELYYAYLLRSWQEGDQRRYSLTEVGSNRRTGFASLTALSFYLQSIEQAVKQVSQMIEEDLDET